MRIFCILQLCFAFTALCSLLGHPFLGDLFQTRALSKQYAFVMGYTSSSETKEKQEVLTRNQARFHGLSQKEQEEIKQSYQTLEKKRLAPFLEKMTWGIDYLFFKTSSLETGWIFFSILIAIALLKERQGASLAVWLLPLISFCYLIEGFSIKAQPSLLPQENYLLANYLKEPLDRNPLKQKEQMLFAWKEYLAKEWSLKGDVEEGIFAFEVARLKEKPQKGETSPLVRLCFLLWNLLFAYRATASREGLKVLSRQSQKPSSCKAHY